MGLHRARTSAGEFGALPTSTAGGFGHLQKGHAIAFADLENRGHEDVFEEMGGAFAGDAYQRALYRNPGHPGHSLTLKLSGVKSNRAAYGARIEVRFLESGVTRLAES